MLGDARLLYSEALYLIDYATTRNIAIHLFIVAVIVTDASKSLPLHTYMGMLVIYEQTVSACGGSAYCVAHKVDGSTLCSWLTKPSIPPRCQSIIKIIIGDQYHRQASCTKGTLPGEVLIRAVLLRKLDSKDNEGDHEDKRLWNSSLDQSASKKTKDVEALTK
ncbi:hypothetical protein KIN20_005936 [Parelaphostrongylus tenuis]|uniref:Uncharacterized protein n=1 Tax=Parelaphostrongylus tenuis TaxID=148309 RepID=A0AAD5QGC7_PARTN|nr:hypothetical protein KIN20_005936 [Parelaphostrongylus tenuis]